MDRTLNLVIHLVHFFLNQFTSHISIPISYGCQRRASMSVRLSVCPSDGALNKSVPSEIRGTTFAPLEPTSQVVKIRTFVFLPVGDLATNTSCIVSKKEYTRRPNVFFSHISKTGAPDSLHFQQTSRGPLTAIKSYPKCQQSFFFQRSGTGPLVY